MTLRRTMVSVLAFWLVAMLLPTGASAEFRLHIQDDNGFSVVVTDEGADDLLSGIPGAIFHSLLISGTEVTVTTAYSKESSPYGTGVGTSEMYLSSFMLTTSDAVNLTLTLEDIDFDRGSTPYLILSNEMRSGVFCGGQPEVASNCDENTSVMLTATAYANANNLQLFGGADPTVMIPDASEGTTATAALLFPCSFGTDCTTPFSGTTTTPFEATSQLYALYTQIVVSFTGAGEVEFVQDTSTTVNDQLVSVPEPASLLLIVTGVFGLACAKRRRSSTARVL